MSTADIFHELDGNFQNFDEVAAPASPSPLVADYPLTFPPSRDQYRCL
jgi:hypothetical protein